MGTSPIHQNALVLSLMAKTQTRLPAILQKHENDLVAEWIKELKTAGSAKDLRINETELFAQAKEFISLLQQAAQGDSEKTTGPEWAAIGQFLETISRSRVIQGFTSDETATFIF